MILGDKDLLNLRGGNLNATFINAIVKGISLLMELGKTLGSTIRRVTTNSSCKIWVRFFSLFLFF